MDQAVMEKQQQRVSQNALSQKGNFVQQMLRTTAGQKG